MATYDDDDEQVHDDEDDDERDGGENDSEAHMWPEALVPAAAARAWIASVLPGGPHVAGPLQVLQAKSWGAVASFVALGTPANAGAAQRGEEVIFKACALPLFAAAPRIAALLARVAPGSVPEVYGWAQRGAQTWTLFHTFEGRSLEELRALEPLLALAQTLARVQVAVAHAPEAERVGLPRLPVERLPDLFEEVLRDVRERQMAYWAGPGREMARPFALPADLPARLEAVRPWIAAWTEELRAGPWPETIDHVDLHWDNAVLQPNGEVLIFDWEEATLSAPFFSLDRLLNDARELDLGEAAAWSLAPDAPLYTPSERALRDAYLAALPWGTPVERARAFTLAMALAPIKTAYEGQVFGDALGWGAGSPFGTAWALARALPRWRELGADV
ncbi:MAG: hypothetical protein ACHQ4H_17220 [Ktedonobacterales bacterium]